MPICLHIVKRCQHSEARLDYGFDWTRTFSRIWAPDRPFGVGIVVRPLGDATGFEYISSGGQSAAEEPGWSRVDGGTTVDGSIIWTAQPVTVDSLMDRISTDLWSDSNPAGLTIEPQPPVDEAGDQVTSAIISGGVPGVVYTIENEVTTFLGYEYVARLILTIE